MSVRLTDSQQRVLTVLTKNDNERYVFTTWQLSDEAARIGCKLNPFSLNKDLDSLERRGLVSGDGTGWSKNHGITEQGIDALNELAEGRPEKGATA